MAGSFIVAARIPMDRDELESWLEMPLGSPRDYKDWPRMFAGWQWSTLKAPKPPDDAGAATVRAWIATRVRATAQGEPAVALAVHDDDALVFYDASLQGEDDAHAQRTLALLRSAASHARSSGYAVYWSAITGCLPDNDKLLAMCEIDRRGSRFVAPSDLAAAGTSTRAVLATLVPAERLYRSYVELQTVTGESSPNLMPYPTPRFVDPAILVRPTPRR